MAHRWILENRPSRGVSLSPASGIHRWAGGCLLLPTPVEKLAVDSGPGAVPGTALGAAVCGFDNRSGSDIARSFPVVPFTLEGLDA